MKRFFFFLWILAAIMAASAVPYFARSSGTPPAAPAGRTHFNVADRLAVENVIYSYTIERDRYDMDAWLALFTEDAVFEVHEPGKPPLVQSGAEFRNFWRKRAAEFQPTGNQRRHLMASIVFEEQTTGSIKTVMNAVITNAEDDKVFTVVSSDQYQGWFTRVNGVWKIKRWIDAPDVTIPGG
jgi:hypothetical protein